MPKEFAALTHSDYVNLCVGYITKERRYEKIERQAQWLALMAVVDHKKKPSSIEKWWPIDGEKPIKFKLPSKDRLKQVDDWVRTYAQIKRNGNT